MIADADPELGIADATNAKEVDLVKVDNSIQRLTVPTVTDWDGPKDPENPQNWSLSIRIGHVVIISILTLIVYVSERRATLLHG